VGQQSESNLMAGTEKVNVREGAIVLQPRALYESQLCDSTLAAEYPSSDRDQQSPICQSMNVTSSQERMIKTSQVRRWVASSRSIL
jgi:hypothetical protein